MTTDLLSSTTHDISSLLPARLLPAVLSASKSSNADTRAKAVELFTTIIAKCSDASVRLKIATEVLALPKTGKSASAEHRVALFNMTKSIPPSDEVSVLIIDTLAPIVAKENNEPALVALSDNLRPHLGHILTSSVSLSSSTLAALAKELNSSKTSTRRALSSGVGAAAWQDASFSPEGEKLLAALAPALETNLVSASANTPANPTGFLEGYVAAALALGPLAKVPGTEKLTKSSSLSSLLVAAPKPSFLLNDKAYAKLPSDTDREWLLRCLEAVTIAQSKKLDSETSR